MSGTLPSTPGFKRVTLRSKQPSAATTAESGRRISRLFGGHLWEFSVTYPPMLRSEFDPVMAFMMLQQGVFESFQVVLPNYATPKGAMTGNIFASPLVLAGSTSAVVYCGAGTTLLAGDIFKFNGHNKVYMVTSDFTSTATGDTLNFMPPLVEDVANLEGLTYSNVPFTVALKNPVQELNTTNPSIFGYEFDVIEAL